MSSNTENIEAKLCAYVDGDLDEQGKLEIEKHLQSNPQHRLLLEELKQTKFMMQALPREVAPPELSETIHGQLERSVLLDGVGTEDVAATMKINRWPQLMAVAAVLFLATGLGVLVWVVLPKPDTVAFDPAAARSDTAAERTEALKSKASIEEIGPVVGKDGTGARFPEDKAVELAKESGRFSKGDAGKFARAPGGGGSGGGELTLTGGKAEATVAENLGKSSEVSAASVRRVLIVLKTDNVTETNGQVATYLDTNKISWSAGEPSVRDVYVASRLRETNVQLREKLADAKVAIATDSALNNPVVNNTTSGVSGNNGFNDVGNKNDGNVNSGKIALKGNSDNYNRDSYQMTQVGRRGDDRLQSQQQLIPGMTQQAQSTQPQVAQQPGSQQQEQPNQSLNLNQQAADVIAQGERRFNLEPARNENVIVARNLSREQAVTMVDSLGKLYAGQTAVVLDRDVLDDYAIKHLPKADEILASSTTQPSTTQPASADQQTGWSQAVGARAGGEGQKQLGEVGPTTLPAAAAPATPDLAQSTTRPTEGEAMGGGVSLPVFSPKQAEDFDLKAQATTQPAELPLEVVIVVQPAAVVPPAATGVVQPSPGVVTEPAVTAAPAPAPATQPGAVEPTPAEMNQNAK